MNHHRAKRNDFRLGDGTLVTIESWIHSTTAHVAAFGPDGHQISLATYQAHVDNPDLFTPGTQASLIDSLAAQLEYDLTNHPELHIRKR
ncbi:MAG TPA: hypothetical protein VGD24_10060 [Gallionella sp.]